MKKRTILQTRLSSLNNSKLKTDCILSKSPFDDALHGLGVSSKAKEKQKKKGSNSKLTKV